MIVTILWRPTHAHLAERGIKHTGLEALTRESPSASRSASTNPLSYDLLGRAALDAESGQLEESD